MWKLVISLVAGNLAGQLVNPVFVTIMCAVPESQRGVAVTVDGWLLCLMLAGGNAMGYLVGKRSQL